MKLFRSRTHRLIRLAVASSVLSALVLGGIGVAAPAQSSAADLRISSPHDLLGLGNRLVFSTIAAAATPPRSFTLHNDTAQPVMISDVSLIGADAMEFALCSASSVSIPASGSTNVCVTYAPTSNTKRISQASLSITTEPDTYQLPVSGLNTVAEEGDNEPNLQQVFEALGYTDNPAVNAQPDSPLFISTSSSAVGDEILSPYWKAFDSSKAVTLTPLARYSGSTAPPQFGWHARGDLTENFAFTFTENQRLLPAPGAVQFTTGGSFGLTVGGEGFRAYSDDSLNPPSEHSFRFYPAKGASGAVIQGFYLVGLDYYFSGNPAKNWDYQDYVFLMSNVQPDLPAPGVKPCTLKNKLQISLRNSKRHRFTKLVIYVNGKKSKTVKSKKLGKGSKTKAFTITLPTTKTSKIKIVGSRFKAKKRTYNRTFKPSCV